MKPGIHFETSNKKVSGIRKKDTERRQLVGLFRLLSSRALYRIFNRRGYGVKPHLKRGFDDFFAISLKIGKIFCSMLYVPNYNVILIILKKRLYTEVILRSEVLDLVL